MTQLLKSIFLVPLLLVSLCSFAQDCEPLKGTGVPSNKKEIYTNLSPNGDYILTKIPHSGIVKLWSTKTGELIKTIDKNLGSNAYSLTWYANDKFFLDCNDYVTFCSTSKGVDNISLSSKEMTNLGKSTVVGNFLYCEKDWYNGILETNILTGESEKIFGQQKQFLYKFSDTYFAIYELGAKQIDLYHYTDHKIFRSIKCKSYTHKNQSEKKKYNYKYFDVSKDGKFIKTCRNQVYDISSDEPILVTNFPESKISNPHVKTETNYCEFQLEDDEPASVFGCPTVKVINTKSGTEVTLQDDLSEEAKRLSGMEGSIFLEKVTQLQKAQDILNSKESEEIADILMDRDFDAGFIKLKALIESDRPINYEFFAESSLVFLYDPQGETWFELIQTQRMREAIQQYAETTDPRIDLMTNDYNRAVEYTDIGDTYTAFDLLRSYQGTKPEKAVMMRDFTNIDNTKQFLDFINNEFYTPYDSLIALKQFDEAIALDPNRSGAYTRKAKALFDSGYYKDALIFANKAIAVNPSTSNLNDRIILYAAYIELTYYDEMDVEKTFALINESKSLHPESIRLKNWESTILMNEERFLESNVVSDEIIALTSKDLLAWGNKVICYYGLNQPEKADQAYRKYNKSHMRNHKKGDIIQHEIFATIFNYHNNSTDPKKLNSAMYALEKSAYYYKEEGNVEMAYDFYVRVINFAESLKNYSDVQSACENVLKLRPDLTEYWHVLGVAALNDAAVQKDEKYYSERAREDAIRDLRYEALSAFRKSTDNKYSTRSREYEALVKKALGI